MSKFSEKMDSKGIDAKELSALSGVHILKIKKLYKNEKSFNMLSLEEATYLAHALGCKVEALRDEIVVKSRSELEEEARLKREIDYERRKEEARLKDPEKYRKIIEIEQKKKDQLEKKISVKIRAIVNSMKTIENEEDKIKIRRLQLEELGINRKEIDTRVKAIMTSERVEEIQKEEKNM